MASLSPCSHGRYGVGRLCRAQLQSVRLCGAPVRKISTASSTPSPEHLMRRCCVLGVVAILVCGADSASAQSAGAIAAQGEASQRSLSEIRQRAEELLIERDLPANESVRNRLTCESAELFKRVGDSRADQLYQEVIGGDTMNAEYRLLYGDYLRTYRGPGQPLVDQAAIHYYKGLTTADTSV